MTGPKGHKGDIGLPGPQGLIGPIGNISNIYIRSFFQLISLIIPFIFSNVFTGHGAPGQPVRIIKIR